MVHLPRCDGVWHLTEMHYPFPKQREDVSSLIKAARRTQKPFLYFRAKTAGVIEII